MFNEKEIRHVLEAKEIIRFHIKQLNDRFDWWKLIEQNNSVYLTGGVVGSLLRGETPKDWDYYFYDINTAQQIKNILESDYSDEIKEITDYYSEHKDSDNKIISTNAITMKSDDSFIFSFAGYPDELRKHFDFVHCLPYYDILTDKLFISKQQYDACVNKKLIYNVKEKDVKGWRIYKFIDRGYTFLEKDYI